MQKTTTTATIAILRRERILTTVQALQSARACADSAKDQIDTILERAARKGHHAVADLLLLYLFNLEVSGTALQWPILSVAAKSQPRIVKDALRRKHEEPREIRRWPKNSLPLHLRCH